MSAKDQSLVTSTATRARSSLPCDCSQLVQPLLHTGVEPSSFIPIPFAMNLGNFRNKYSIASRGIPILLLVTAWFLASRILGGRDSADAQRIRTLSDSGVRGQRLIKISFRGQYSSFRVRINQDPVEKLRNSNFTNLMDQLRLEYGDVVVWDTKRDGRGKELTHPKNISTWWFKRLRDLRASFYLSAGADFFTKPIYHWKAPFEKPRPLDDATFFVDGVLLGKGSPGFQKMLETIEGTGSGSVLIVAPRIKNEGQESPWIATNQLLAWADDAGMVPQFEKILYGRSTWLTDIGRLDDE